MANVQQCLTVGQSGELECFVVPGLPGHYAGESADHIPANPDTACTYRAWLRVRLDRDIDGDLTPVRVQVLRRGIKACGVVLDASMGDGSQDWFQVRQDGFSGSNWLPGSKVRLCSGDGRCTCEKAANEAAGFGRACAAMPAASVVPPGNTGTTIGGKA